MKKKTAQTLLTNGRFLTMEQPGEIAEAVAIANGRILFVGSAAEAAQFVDANTTVIDLQGKVAAPGLIDCHTHPMGSYAVRYSGVNLLEVRSVEAMLERIREKAAQTPKGEWIVARGFDESKLGGAEVNAALLDRAAPEHPVYAVRTCGHVAVLNSLAMERSGFNDDSQSPPGGQFFRDEQGHLTGMISGSVKSRVPFPSPTDEQYKDSMLHGMQPECFHWGITATADMGVKAKAFELLQELDREGKLKLRVGTYFVGGRKAAADSMPQILAKSGLRPGFGSEHLFFRGIKFVMDGSTGGRTAAFSQPYQGQPENFGELYNDPKILNENIYISAKAGLQISIHAIGDRAIEGALAGLEYAKAKGIDIPSLRPRIEHLESPTAGHIRRIKELGGLVGLSSAFIYHLGDSHISGLGHERVVDAFPAKTLMDEGITIACNTDCPVCDINPMLGIYSMVTRTTEAGQSFGGRKEAVDRIRALEAYTKNPAWLLGLESVAGTLKAGKYADIVVFREDYLNIPEEQLKDVQVAMTLSSGEIVYENRE